MSEEGRGRHEVWTQREGVLSRGKLKPTVCLSGAEHGEQRAGAEDRDVSQEPKWEWLLGPTTDLLMKWKIS